SNAIPGWTSYIAGVPQTDIAYNDISLGAAWVSIHDMSDPSLVLQGRYSVLLQPSFGGPPTSAAIGQTAQIPQGAQSVRFFGTGGYTVTFAGQQIPLAALGAD